jgi:hypothetical protein
MEDLVQFRTGLLIDGDADAAVQLFFLELGVELAQGDELSIDEPSLFGGLIISRVGAKIEILRPIPVMKGRFNGPRVHAAIDSVHHQATESLKIGDMAVDQPGNAVAHLEDVFENNGPHPHITGLSGSLDGIHPPGTALQMGSRMDVHVDCSLEELKSQFERSVICEFHSISYSIIITVNYVASPYRCQCSAGVCFAAVIAPVPSGSNGHIRIHFLF